MDVETHHRNMAAALRIRSGRSPGPGGAIQPVAGGGTLTGLATRNSDSKKVLVSAMHVFAGRTGEDDEKTLANPEGNEIICQGDLVAAHVEDSRPVIEMVIRHDERLKRLRRMKRWVQRS